MIETIGGVSPLKAKRQASRGGKHAGKATSTSKRRGGFAKSTGKRGGGGRNVGGYNVQTRFKADKWVPPPSGGTTYLPKPYSYDPEGNLQVNPPGGDQTQNQEININTGPGSDAEWKKEYWEKTTKENLPTYRATYDANKKGVKDKYKTFEDYVAAADKWWVDEAGKKGMSVEEFKNTYRKEKTESGWRWVKIKDATTGKTTIDVKQSQSQK